MESKLPIGPVRSRTWHPTTSEKLITPTVKRPATTLGITHPPVITSTVIQRPLTRPKTTTGNKNIIDQSAKSLIILSLIKLYTTR